METPDRTENVEGIFLEFKRLASKDMRVGQVFVCIRKGEDLFYLENDELLKRLKEL